MKYIIQKNGAYNFYSTVTDGACYVSALTLSQLKKVIKEEQGTDGLSGLPHRLERARLTGCSSLIDRDLRSAIDNNQEGISYDEFVGKYLTLYLHNRHGDIPTGVAVTFEVENPSQWGGSHEGVLEHDGVGFVISTEKGIVTINRGYDAYLHSVKPLVLCETWNPPKPATVMVAVEDSFIQVENQLSEANARNARLVGVLTKASEELKDGDEGHAASTLIKAITANSESVAAFEAEKLEPLRREIAMLRRFLELFPQHSHNVFDLESECEICTARNNTQATAEAYEREVIAKALDNAADEQMQYADTSSGVVYRLHLMAAELRANKGKEVV